MAVADLHRLLGGEARFQSHLILVFGVDVVVLLHTLHGAVGHADLLALVEEGQAPKQDADGAQHLHTLLAAQIGRQKAAAAPGFVVVFQNVSQETHPHALLLGLEDGPAQVLKGDIVVGIPAHGAVGQAVGREIEHGGEVAVFAHELLQLLFFHVENFRNGECVILFKGVFLQGLKLFTHAVHAFDHFYHRRRAVRHVRFIVGEGQVFLDVDDGIDAEAGDPFFQPPVHHSVQFLQNPRIFPVQVRLLLGEGMEIVQILMAGHRLPGAAAEVGAQIVGRIAVFALAEIEILAVLPFRVSQCLLEPGMLVGAVVDDQVHDNVHVPLFRLGQQLVEFLHGAEGGVDAIVVRNVVALVHKGRGING